MEALVERVLQVALVALVALVERVRQAVPVLQAVVLAVPVRLAEALVERVPAEVRQVAQVLLVRPEVPAAPVLLSPLEHPLQVERPSAHRSRMRLAPWAALRPES